MPLLIVLGVLVSVAGGFLLLYSPDAEASTSENPLSGAFSTIQNAFNFNWKSAVGLGDNVSAMIDLIVKLEANGEYNVIAGGDHFSDYSEHPFILDPSRPKPLGTTASGGLQMVVGTWKMARDSLGLTDFSPESQRAAGVWILQYKRPGAYDAVVSGDLSSAMRILAPEWEAFAKILNGTYPYSVADVQNIFTANGGNLVA